MIPILRLVVALEMMLLPAWVAATVVRPPPALLPRLGRAAAGLLAAAVAVLILAALSDPSQVVAALRTQAVAAGWAMLLAGLAIVLERAAGPRAGQILTALVGWLILSAAVLAGPPAVMADETTKAVLVRTVVHANPLIVAELELGLRWLHQDLTYRLTPLGESYGYLLGGLAWWKTVLSHVFVGTGLAVFGMRRERPDGSL